MKKFDCTPAWLDRRLAIADDSQVAAGGGELPAPTQVRALFVCNAVETLDFGSCKQTKVRMGAIYGTGEEAKTFNDATPSGEFWMTISEGRPAAKLFKPGERYYLDFTKAPGA
jgi:hypothetical protein